MEKSTIFRLFPYFLEFHCYFEGLRHYRHLSAISAFACNYLICLFLFIFRVFSWCYIIRDICPQFHLCFKIGVA
jgi:hypothetical protein